MKVNLACGQAYMEGWVNVDDMPSVKADIYSPALDFIRDRGSEITELYMGHFLEHVMPGYARSLLTLMAHRLPEGAVVSAVTPDMRAIFEAYLRGEIDNHKLNASFVYSYVQPSHHIWCYDEASLVDLFRSSGFDDVEPIDPQDWEPVFHKDGEESEWQCGVRAVVPAAWPAVVPEPVDEWLVPEPEKVDPADLPVTPMELLLHRLERLEHELERQQDRYVDSRRELDHWVRHAQRLEGELERVTDELESLRASRTYKTALGLRKVADSVLPVGGPGRRVVGKVVRSARSVTR
jgi:predicted SAM-dependent methyltransferase